jgi:hypothetical protein
MTRPATGRTGFGVATTQGATFEVDDKRARDLGFARTKWPDFDFTKVNAFVPDVAAIGNPLFVRAGQQP